MRAWAILLVAALLAPLASAGDEAHPDVVDTVDTRIQDRSLDFLALWLQPYPSGVQVTFKVASANGTTPGDVWAMSFVLGGVRYVPAVGVLPDGTLKTCLCPENFGQHGIHAVADFNGGLRDAAFKTGKPAYVTVVIPYDGVPGLGPGVVLEDVRAGTDKAQNGGFTDVDGAFGADPYVVQRAFLPPAAAAAVPYVLAGIALVGAGAGIAILVMRRRAREAPPAHGPAAPKADARDAPPAGRMTLRPPP